ncbi:MAG: acetyltransferase [Akkermansiaceae bacterium]|nr:acetyltransferase [Akkermansiaceae bacterium]
MLENAKYRVRAARPSDDEALAEIFRASRLEAFHRCETEDFFLSDFADQTQGEVIHVAESPDGTLAGFVSVWEPESFVHHLFIDPRFHRQGIGKLLLRSLETWLPFPHELKCLVANQRAAAFYAAMGWREIDRGSDPFGAYLVMSLERPIA